MVQLLLVQQVRQLREKPIKLKGNNKSIITELKGLNRKRKNWLKYEIMKRKFNLFSVVLFCLVFWFIYHTGKKSLENRKLANKGVICKGVVLSKKNVGSKGTIRIEYKFEVNKKFYRGTISNENWVVGDSIEIIYLLDDPNINRSLLFIKSNYKIKS